MKNRDAFLVGAAAGAVLGGLTWVITRKVTEPIDVEPLRIGSTFPSVTGTLLSGETLTVPDELTGSFSLLVVGWDYDARFEVSEWGRALMNAYADQPALTILEVPMISGVGALMRKIIDAAMVRETSEEERGHVLTVYGDLRRLRKQLAVSDPKHAQVFVLGRTGRLIWRTDGPPTVDLLAGLQEILSVQGIGGESQ